MTTTTSSTDAFTPSRRAVLLAAASGLIAVAGLAPENDAEATSTTGSVGAATELPRLPMGLAAPGGTLPAATAVTLTHPRATPHWTNAVRRLDDFHREVPRPAFARHAIMLTLDDGPHPVWTPRFLALLERHHVTATFFVIGSQVRRDRGIVREVLARGHVIGNHTWSHDEMLGHRSTRDIASEIHRTNEAVHSASGNAGYVPYLFRAPGGMWTHRLMTYLNAHHLVPVGWSVDPSDWARPGTAAIRRSLLHAKRHDIALCHDGGGDRTQTYRALRTVLPAWQQHGLTFTTLPRP